MARLSNKFLFMLGVLSFSSITANANRRPGEIHYPKFESQRISAIKRRDVARPVTSHSVPSTKKTIKPFTSIDEDKSYVYSSFYNRNNEMPSLTESELEFQRRFSKDYYDVLHSSSQDSHETAQKKPERVLEDDPDNIDSSSISEEVSLDDYYHDSIRVTKSKTRRKLKDGPQKITPKFVDSKRKIRQKIPLSRKYDHDWLASENQSEEILVDQKEENATKTDAIKKVTPQLKKKKLKRRKVLKVRNRQNNNNVKANSSYVIPSTTENVRTTNLHTSHEYGKSYITTEIPTPVTISPSIRGKANKSNTTVVNTPKSKLQTKSGTRNGEVKRKSAWSRDKIRRTKIVPTENIEIIHKRGTNEDPEKHSDSRVRTSFNKKFEDRNIRHSKVKNEQIQHKGANVQSGKDDYPKTEKASSRNVNGRFEKNTDVANESLKENFNDENDPDQHEKVQEIVVEGKNVRDSERKTKTTWQKRSNKKTNENISTKNDTFQENPEFVDFNKSFKKDFKNNIPTIEENYRINQEAGEEYLEKPDINWSSMDGEDNRTKDDDYFMLSYKYMGNEKDKEKDVTKFPHEISKPAPVKKAFPIPEKKLPRKKLSKTADGKIKYDSEDNSYVEPQKQINYQFSKRHREYLPLENDKVKYNENEKIISPKPKIHFREPEKSSISFRKKEIKQVTKPSWAPMKHFSNSQGTHKHENRSNRKSPTTNMRPAFNTNHKSSSFLTFSRGNEKLFEQDFPTKTSKTFENLNPKSNLGSSESGKYFMHVFKRVGDVSLEDFDIKNTKFPDKDGFTSLMKLSWNDDDRKAHVETAIDTRMRTPRVSFNTYYHPDDSIEGETAQASETISDHGIIPESEEYALPTAQDFPEESSMVFRTKRSANNENHFVRSHFQMGGNNFMNIPQNNNRNLPQTMIHHLRARERSRSIPYVQFPKSTIVAPRYADPPNSPRNVQKPLPHQVKSYYLKPVESADRKKLMREFENQNLGMKFPFDTYEKPIRESKQINIFQSYASPQRVQTQMQNYDSFPRSSTPRQEVIARHNNLNYLQNPTRSPRTMIISNFRTPSETKPVKTSVQPMKDFDPEEAQIKDFSKIHYPAKKKYSTNHNNQITQNNARFVQTQDKIEHSPTEIDFHHTLSNSQIRNTQRQPVPVRKAQHRQYSSLDDSFLNYPTMEMKRYQDEPRNAHFSFQSENENTYHDNSHVLSGNHPRYHTIPKTHFSCEEKRNAGYYADSETGCQVFHMCHSTGVKHSFLCPNGTIFNQHLLVCDWYNKVNCENAESVYRVNEQLFNHHSPREDRGNTVDYSDYGWESKPLQARTNPYQEYSDRKGPDTSVPMRRSKSLPPPSSPQPRNYMKNYEQQIDVSKKTHQANNAEYTARTIQTTPSFQRSTERPKVQRPTTVFEDKVNQPKGFHYFTENEYLVIHSEVPLKRNETESPTVTPYVNKSYESDMPSKTSSDHKKVSEHYSPSKNFHRRKPITYNKSDKKFYSIGDKKYGQKVLQQPNLKRDLKNSPKERSNNVFNNENIQEVSANTSLTSSSIKPLFSINEQRDKIKSLRPKILKDNVKFSQQKSTGQTDKSGIITKYAKDGILFPSKSERSPGTPLRKYYTNSNTNKKMSSSESSIYVYPLQGMIQNNTDSKINITNPPNTVTKLAGEVNKNSQNLTVSTKPSNDIPTINITSRIVGIISGLDTIGDDISKILDGKDSIYKNVQVHKLIPKKSENVGNIEIPIFESDRKPQKQNKQAQKQFNEPRVSTVKPQEKSHNNLKDSNASFRGQPNKPIGVIPNIPLMKTINNPYKEQRTNNISSSQQVENHKHFIKFVSTEPTNTGKHEISTVFPTAIPSGLKLHGYTIQVDAAPKINYSTEESREYFEKVKYVTTQNEEPTKQKIGGNAEIVHTRIPQAVINVKEAPSLMQNFEQHNKYESIPKLTLHQNLPHSTFLQNPNQVILPKTINVKSNNDITGNNPHQFSYSMYAPPHTNVHFHHSFNDDNTKLESFPSTDSKSGVKETEQHKILNKKPVFPSSTSIPSFIFTGKSLLQPEFNKQHESLTVNKDTNNFPVQKTNERLTTKQKTQSTFLETPTSNHSPIVNNQDTEECDDSSEADEKLKINAPPIMNIETTPQNFRSHASQTYNDNKSGFKSFSISNNKQLQSNKGRNTEKNLEHVLQKPYYINEPPRIIKSEAHDQYQKGKENITPTSAYETNIPSNKMTQPDIKLVKFFKDKHSQKSSEGDTDFVPQISSQLKQNIPSSIESSYNRQPYSTSYTKSSVKPHGHGTFYPETTERDNQESKSKYADLERAAELEALKKFKSS